MMCQDFNGKFNIRIRFKFNQKKYIKIMRCKIVKFQKLMWRNMIRSTKNQKVSVLHYSIDMIQNSKQHCLDQTFCQLFKLGIPSKAVKNL